MITWAGITTSNLEFVNTIQSFNNIDEDNNGFYKVIKSNGALEFFVSVDGDDLNDGLTPLTAFKTAAKAEEMARDGFADIIRFRCGEDFTVDGTTVFNDMKSGKSLNEPRVISTYDDHLGVRPVIDVISFNQTSDVKRFISVIGVQYPEGGSGSRVTMIADTDGIHFEDCVFSRVEFTMQNGKNFSYIRNIGYGAYHDGTSTSSDSRPSQLFVNNTDGLNIVGNVFDQGGWSPDVFGAGANLYNHNVYLQTDVNGFRLSFVNNISTRASAHSAQLRSGGIANYNFAGRCAVGMTLGYATTAMLDGVPCYDFNSVSSEGYSMMKGAEQDPQNPDGLVACTVGGLCTGALWGSWISLHGNADYKQYSCVSSKLADDDNLSFPTGLIRIKRSFYVSDDFGIPDSALDVQNIAAYHWVTPTEGDDDGYTDPDRTLGTYYQFLLSQGLTPAAGDDDFDSFMNIAKSRLRGQWDERVSAKEIVKYIQAGYDVPEYIIGD